MIQSIKFNFQSIPKSRVKELVPHKSHQIHFYFQNSEKTYECVFLLILKNYSVSHSMIDYKEYSLLYIDTLLENHSDDVLSIKIALRVNSNHINVVIYLDL
jgi:hypothetical protein